MALGHIILGAEESLKAMALYSQTVDFLNVNIKNSKDHSTRHKELADLHWIWRNLVETFLSVFQHEEIRNAILIIDGKSINDEKAIRKWWKRQTI